VLPEGGCTQLEDANKGEVETIPAEYPKNPPKTEVVPNKRPAEFLICVELLNRKRENGILF